MKETAYEEFVKTTDLSNHTPIFYIFGMLEEAGEIAGVCKRALRGDYGIDVMESAEEGNWNRVFKNSEVKMDLIKEKGDVGWYGTRLEQVLGVTRSFVELENMKKLEKRVKINIVVGKGDNRENT